MSGEKCIKRIRVTYQTVIVNLFKQTICSYGKKKEKGLYQPSSHTQRYAPNSQTSPSTCCPACLCNQCLAFPQPLFSFASILWWLILHHAVISQQCSIAFTITRQHIFTKTFFATRGPNLCPRQLNHPIKDIAQTITNPCQRLLPY